MHLPFSQSEAAEDLFRRYYRPLCLYALHYVADADTVEDIVQDCFLKLLEQQPGTVASEQAWLYSVVRHACLHHRRQAAQEAEDLSHLNSTPSAEVALSATDFDGTPITDQEAQSRSRQEAALWAAIDALPPRCREIFLMAKRDGLHYSDIAQTLGISEKTVEHQVAKALHLLRGSGGMKRLSFVLTFF